MEPANDDPYEFGTSQPCPLAADGAVQLDTATLRDGQHTVHVTVEDAAGNEATVFDGIVQTTTLRSTSAAPTLTGSANVGAQLNAGHGQWDGAPSGYDHRWLRCEADGTACAPVAGATGTTYTLTGADAYHRMEAEVIAENGSGASTARSAPSAIVADAAGHTTPPSEPKARPGTGEARAPAAGHDRRRRRAGSRGSSIRWGSFPATSATATTRPLVHA